MGAKKRFAEAKRSDLLDVPRPETLHYERKFVCFFDILGWRSKIDAAGDDPAKIADLQTILALFTTLARQTEDTDRSKTRITTFSDNVVISHSLQRQRSLIFLLGLMQLTAASHGFLLRGGLTAGQVVHNDLVVFGPGLNRAYELESREAVFPRIVIDPAWLAIFKEPYSFIVQEDGVYFFDFFTKVFSGLVSDVTMSTKMKNPEMIDASFEELRLHEHSLLVESFRYLTEEVKRPLGEKEWRKVAWLYDRVRRVIGSPVEAKHLRRTVLHW